MPLPNSRVIPEAWSRHHAQAATGAMNATVTIGEKDGPPVADGDNFTQGWTDDYTGPARIQALNDSNRTSTNIQELIGRSYLVQLDMALATVDYTPGMRIKVLTAINDAQLVGQDLWIIDPQYGSERFTRDVVASDNQSDVPSQ